MSFVAATYYSFNTFRGYAILPFIRKPEYFLLAIPVLSGLSLLRWLLIYN